MTPPKIPNKSPSFLDWAPGQADSAAQGSDCDNCHSAPKKNPDLSFQNPSPWFLDQLKAKKPVDDSDAAAIQAFLEGNLPPVSSPPALKSTPTSSTLKPGAPKDAEALQDQAKELERQARLSLDPAKKIAFFHSALSFRLLAGDDVASQANLKELEGLYAKGKNETGQKFVAALQLWTEGKTGEALKALAELDKPAQGVSWDFYQTYSATRSLLLQSAAGEKLKAQDYPGAKALLMEALNLTPSDQLTGKVLKLLAEHGEADLQGQRQNIAALKERRETLAKQSAPCNTGCHTDNSKLPATDFDHFTPMLSTKLGAPSMPDFSAYSRLTHLSYAQKAALYNLDKEIETANTQYQNSLEMVRTILFSKTFGDPKKDNAAIEATLLKSATAFSEPDRSLPFQLAGEAYLVKKDYAKAAAALQASVREDSSNVNAQFSYGRALFATGDFQASSEAYGKILEHEPQEVNALRYRIDANSHFLASLDPKLHATEIAQAEGEIASDRALLVARCSQGEKDKIAELSKQLDRLHEGGDTALEVRQETLAMLEMLAKQYLALAETKQSGVENAKLVRKELNGLAAQTFDLLAKFAKADSDPTIQKKSGLYSGYSLLAQGKIDEAEKAFAPYRKDFPEIEKILGSLEKSKLRMVNLAALDAWSVYNKEGERVQTDAQSGVIGGAIGFFESLGRSDGKDFRDDTKVKWKGDVAFVAELRKRIESGKADTILQAMEQVEKDGSETMKSRARSYINYEDQLYTGYPLGALVHFVDKLPPDDGEAETLLRKTWDLERQNPAVETPYAFYTIVNALSPDVSFNGTPRQHMDALEGKGSFGRSAFKFITSMSPESLAVDVALMAGSAGLGNLAKLAALSKLEKAGVTGYKAIVLAGAAGVGVEVTALWAANLGKEAMLQDPSKVFTQDHMLKSYGATLIMIGGLKGFGALGESFAPRAAKSLGLVTEGGSKLTAGGKVLTWSIGHGSGLGGMVATSHVNQAAGLTPKPIGGWKEGLVHDVFGYVQFAVAHKIADRALSGKLSTISQRQYNEVAVKEAIVLAKSQADAMGFRATRNAKGEIVDSPERKAIVGLLTEASLTKPGLSGSKLEKLVAARKFGEANKVFAEFGLPLEYNRAGQLLAVARGELSPHAAAGTPAGKAKPPRTRVEAEAYFKELGQKATELLDKAAEWLFGPPGGGGFGGLEPAMAGAYGAAKVRVAPKEAKKGPEVLLRSGEAWGGSAHKALEKFESTLLEHEIFDITHNGKPELNPTEVAVGLENKAGIEAVAQALRGELPKELTTLYLQVGETLTLADLAILTKAAHAKGIDVLVYEKGKGEDPIYNIVGNRYIVADEAAAARLTEAALRSGQDIEIAFGKDSKTRAKISGDKVELNLKAKTKGEQIDLLQSLLSAALKENRNLTIEWNGQSFSTKISSGRIEIKGSNGENLSYIPSQGNYRARLEIKLPKGTDANQASVLLRVAAELEPAQLQRANVLVEGLDLSLGGTVKGNLSLLIQKSLWGEANAVQIGSGKDIYIETGLKGSAHQYTFSTKLPFEQGSSYLAEHLAFESAKALGATGHSDINVALMQSYYRSAFRQALELHQNAKPEKQAEYRPYVDGNYVKAWSAASEKMVDFAGIPKQREQLSEVLAKMRDYSQRETNDFLGFKPFDGRAFADNAFEMNRIFEAARADSSIELPKVLADVSATMGTEGKVEVYGAGVGMIYKMHILGDKAAKNEFDRFQTMKNEAVLSGRAFRFSIIPEDRLQGSNYGTTSFTKTPEWIVQELDASGQPTKMASVEVTTADGSLTDSAQVSRKVAEKVFQVSSHEFGKENNQGDALIVFRLYKAAGREADLTQMLLDGLRTEYGQNASKAKAKEKIRVMVIFEDPSFPAGSKTRWLEYDSGGNWKLRESDGVTENSGTTWKEPFYQAMGW